MRYVYENDLLPLIAFRSETGRPGGRLLSLEGKDSAPAPDYKGAAEATAQGNLDATRAAAAANRVNQYTPYGNLTYSHNPTETIDYAAYNAAMDKYNSDLKAYNEYLANPTAGQQTPNYSGVNDYFYNGTNGPTVTAPQAPIKPTEDTFKTTNPDEGWSATQTLSPTEQAKLEANNKLSLGLLNTAQTGLGYVDKLLSNGGSLDESKLSQMPISGQSVQDAIFSRLQPQLQKDRAALSTQLANKGLMEGSEAYKNAMLTQDQKENDLYTDAALQGINTALSARQQGIQEQYAGQDRPLNIVNALRTGNQVQLPNFANIPQQQTSTGADLLGASQLQGQYNSAQTASNNASTTGTIGSIATAIAAYY